jgi:hypothetical protein
VIEVGCKTNIQNMKVRCISRLGNIMRNIEAKRIEKDMGKYVIE